MANKSIYKPTERAIEIVKTLRESETPLSFGEITAKMGKIGTATVKALVDNGYVEIAEVKDVICPTCGAKKKGVRFYKATDKEVA